LYSVLTPEAIKAGIEAHEQLTASERATIDQRLAALGRRLKELDREADNMIAAFKADIISMDELAKIKRWLTPNDGVSKRNAGALTNCAIMPSGTMPRR